MTIKKEGEPSLESLEEQVKRILRENGLQIIEPKEIVNISFSQKLKDAIDEEDLQTIPDFLNAPIIRLVPK
jgi:hypothetical protein